MTPRLFEAHNTPVWQELEDALDRAEKRPAREKDKTARDLARKAQPLDGARLAQLYRLACEHLALSQARAYPIHLTQRLESLTQRAHRVIYRRHDYGLARLRELALVDFPQGVRRQRWHLLAAMLLFTVPAIAAGIACWADPEFVLHIVSAQQAQQFDQMYSSSERALGRLRSAETDWQMFGYYVRHNIGIGFQCFAGGIFLGLGSLFFILYNGVVLGAVAGYLTARGHGENFWPFVATHGAFELTAIVLAGAAGLQIGHALIAPGRHTRLESLRLAALDAIVVMYGVIGMLVIAAAIEAFWSSARWVPPEVKYGVSAVCWAGVLAYLGLQGRPAAAGPVAPRSTDAG